MAKSNSTPGYPGADSNFPLHLIIHSATDSHLSGNPVSKFNLTRSSCSYGLLRIPARRGRDLCLPDILHRAGNTERSLIVTTHTVSPLSSR